MIRFLCGFLGGVLILMGALEVLFRALPVSTATLTAYHSDPEILSYPPHHGWRSATGWDLRNAQTLRANGAGFAAEIEFTRDSRALALIGDSYVEASMLPAADRPGAALSAALNGQTPVFSLGSPGTALLDYAHRIRWAAREFGVRRFVVWMEAGDVRQSFCGSGNVHAHCLDPLDYSPRVELQPPPGPLKAVLRHSALAQYVVSQLKFSWPRLRQGLFGSSVPGHEPAPEGVPTPPVERQSIDLAEHSASMEISASRRKAEAVADAFFSMLQGVEIDDLVIVVSGNPARPTGIDRSVRPLPPSLAAERSAFMQYIEGRRGAVQIDADRVVGQHWRQSDLSLVVGPYDGHLNPLGVRLLMAEVAQVLNRPCTRGTVQ